MPDQTESLDRPKGPPPTNEVKYPGIIQVAGILWLVAALSSFAFAGAAVWVVNNMDQAMKAKTPRPTARLGEPHEPLRGSDVDPGMVYFAMVLRVGFGVMVGVPCVLFGILAVARRRAGVLPVGIVSVFLGLFMLTDFISLLGAEMPKLLLVPAAGLAALTLTSGGVVALTGVGWYRRWEKARTAESLVVMLEVYNKSLAGEIDAAVDERAVDSTPVKYPPAVRNAGVCWLLVPCVQVVAVIIALSLPQPTAPVPQQTSITQQRNQVPPRLTPPPPPSTGLTQEIALFIGLGCSGCVALVFLVTGLQALNGWASSFVGAGVGSCFLSLLFASGAVTVIANAGHLAVAVGPILCAALAFVAGAFALVGSKEYARWREWRKKLEAFRTMDLPKFGRSGP